MITTKKARVKIGQPEYYINPKTGEQVPMQNYVIEERDFNFNKVWLQHLINGLDDISNQKLRLAFWIIDNLDYENKLVMTQRAIAEGSQMSLDTVSRTMKALQNSKPSFLQKINSGAYRVNPDIIWKGSHSNRMGICYEYITQENSRQLTFDETEEPKEDIAV